MDGADKLKGSFDWNTTLQDEIKYSSVRDIHQVTPGLVVIQSYQWLAGGELQAPTNACYFC